MPRDGRAAVGPDRSTGLGWAGGHVGSGVATAGLAARTSRLARTADRAARRG
ncbi:hypothetical protein [Streptomyces sp. NPDC046985]|uniref:hypothetical protein n=1 Tax=Streptomyces sp. NPDC046985 TaxID=3155377 RepID=UPI0033D803FB